MGFSYSASPSLTPSLPRDLLAYLLRASKRPGLKYGFNHNWNLYMHRNAWVYVYCVKRTCSISVSCSRLESKRRAFGRLCLLFMCFLHFVSWGFTRVRVSASCFQSEWQSVSYVLFLLRSGSSISRGMGKPSCGTPSLPTPFELQIATSQMSLDTHATPLHYPVSFLLMLYRRPRSLRCLLMF
jgi:hypothetical protein